MKKHFPFILLLLAALAFNSQAQEAIFRAQSIVSPEIHKDESVTFRLFAPNA